MEIIAEIGQNHNGDMHLAQEMIYAAKENGADVAKFQLYDAVKLFPREGNIWYEYNCKTELSKEQVWQLFETCRKARIEFMASIFDAERLEWLEELGVSRYKIASRSIFEKDLISKTLSKNKPVLISLGMWDQAEFPKFQQNEQLISYLYCVSKYPTELKELHFHQVDFGKYSGFSDHTLGINASLVAFSRGARILEKHFTLDKNMYGPDHSCSMTPNELKSIDNFRKDLNLMLQ